LDNRLELLYLFFKLGYSRISRVDGHDSNVPSNHVSEQVFSRTLNSYKERGPALTEALLTLDRYSSRIC
ncbi:MAG: hypothetical protein QNJ97_21480, partial [Myxococcota bacterium]|nr:hypothetical protein [Myxococcota bacterium]